MALLLIRCPGNLSKLIKRSQILCQTVTKVLKFRLNWRNFTPLTQAKTGGILTNNSKKKHLP